VKRNPFRPWLAASLLSLAPAIQAQTIEDELRERVDSLRSAAAPTLLSHRVLTSGILIPMYEEAGFQPLWGDSAKVEELRSLVRDAEQHGMLPEDFFLYTLDRMPAPEAMGGAGQRADYDLLMTEALLRYLYNRRFGKVNPESIDRNINFRREVRPGEPVHRTILGMIDDGGLAAEIDALTMHGPWYRALQGALAELTGRAAAGGWGRVTEGPTLRPGDRGPRVAELRRRLAAAPGSPATLDDGSDDFDGLLEAAVRTFQQDHALDADGLVGPATQRALNVPIEHRIDQLRLSLERLRWVSEDVENQLDFVAVNIAGFRIYLVEDGQLRWTTRAMVGKPYRQTPVFTGRMQYLEFNPTWTVPPGIHRNDTLPAIKRDVNYLAKSHMTVLTPSGEVVDPLTVDWQSYGRAAPFIFRQEPGPWNALGQVKFIFPNPHFVFLHDTNHRELFDRPSRAFSSGCIRVQDPLKLAELLLERENGWDRNRIDGVLASQQTRRVNLSTTLPVYLLYLTAAPDVDGSVLFLEDVYERDGRLLTAINAPLRLDLPPLPDP
jgi:murein L,D-transpeptidase YcbB/YkuD